MITLSWIVFVARSLYRRKIYNEKPIPWLLLIFASIGILLSLIFWLDLPDLLHSVSQYTLFTVTAEGILTIMIMTNWALFGFWAIVLGITSPRNMFVKSMVLLDKLLGIMFISYVIQYGAIDSLAMLIMLVFYVGQALMMIITNIPLKKLRRRGSTDYIWVYNAHCNLVAMVIIIVYPIVMAIL
jgi:hypothetical protein